MRALRAAPARRRLTTTAVAVAALAALAGCQRLEPTAADAEDLARDYLRAVQARDWTAACATRTRLERHELALRRGSCERGIRDVLAAHTAELAGATPGEVRVKGELAAIEVRRPDGALVTVLTAVRDPDEWRLETLPPGQARP